jgi:parallel beta-helix repeat protein
MIGADKASAAIAYLEHARALARQNECSENALGILVQETADPSLVDNNCRENTEADTWDKRP